MYFPWDHINWIEEELSNDGRAFIIPWNLFKPVSIRLKEGCREPFKQVYVTKPTRLVFPGKLITDFAMTHLKFFPSKTYMTEGR